ncbi:hypothetical protein ScPMuIL_005270 [Solemya velum]
MMEMGRIYLKSSQCLQWSLLQQASVPRLVLLAVPICFALLILVSFVMQEYPSWNYNSVRVGDIEKNKRLALGPDVHYGIVIDCGSSGSRVFVYFWPPHSGNAKDLLNIQQLMDEEGKPVVKKVSPGLDTFEDKTDEASEYIKPLLEFAGSYIPKESHKTTLLYVMATAGMRMLSKEHQDKILEDLQQDIPKSFDFIISDNNFEVITGKQEGVYAWIAANYVLQKFSHGEAEHPLVAVPAHSDENPKIAAHVRRRTVGMIDMGGGSLQIAFEVPYKASGIPKDLTADFNLGCQNSDMTHSYRVYVTTFLGYGANVARERYEQLLINQTKKNDGEATQQSQRTTLTDPCLPPGSLSEPEDETYMGTYRFQGTGSFDECKVWIGSLLNLTVPCELPSCSLNGVHQPEISFEKTEFYGYSEFWYTMEDVFRQGGLYESEKFENQAKEFCSTPWATLQDWYGKNFYPKADKHRFRFQCFKSAWMTSVLHKGFKFPTVYKSLRSVQYINNKEVQWTLGALIHRTRYLPLRDIEDYEKQMQQQHHPPNTMLNPAIFYYQYIIILCFLVPVSKLAITTLPNPFSIGDRQSEKKLVTISCPHL